MAFKFSCLGKTTQPHKYAVKDLQEFFLSLPPANSYIMNSYRKDKIKKELPDEWINIIIQDMMMSVFGQVTDISEYNNRPNVVYGNRLLSEKYNGVLNQTIEGYYNTFGKDKLDDLILDIKSIFDDNIFATICSNGEWVFPDSQLYEACEKAGITDLNNNFAKQKAIAIAKSILNESRVPAKYAHLYISAEQISNRFNNGKLIYKQQQIAKEGKLKTPRHGYLNESQERCVVLSNNLKNLFGIDKRIYILEDVIKTLDKKIREYEEGQKAIRDISVILNASVKQTKKHDWAFLGGLAEGIAGTGAGIAVAANAIAENAEIEKRNQQARYEANKTIQELYGNASSLSTEITDLKNEKKLMQYHLKNSREKVVLEEYITEQIFEKLDISSEIKKLDSNNGLEIVVSINNHFKADVPSNVLVAVDGILMGEIYYENKYLETVVIPLPMFGVTNEETLTMYTDYHVEKEGSYSVEITPKSLWIVEV